MERGVKGFACLGIALPSGGWFSGASWEQDNRGSLTSPSEGGPDLCRSFLDRFSGSSRNCRVFWHISYSHTALWERHGDSAAVSRWLHLRGDFWGCGDSGPQGVAEHADHAFLWFSSQWCDFPDLCPEILEAGWTLGWWAGDSLGRPEPNIPVRAGGGRCKPHTLKATTDSSLPWQEQRPQ